MTFVSALCLSLCFFGLSIMPGTLPMFFAITILLNVLGCATGPIGYTRVIAVRFRRSRGTALAIALLGIASVGIMLPPVLAATLDRFGWRGGYRLLAALVAIGSTVALILIRSEERSPEHREGTAGALLAFAIRERPFWALGIAIFCVSIASLGFVSHFQSIVIDSGLPAGKAPAFLSLLATSVLLSRLAVGWALDQYAAEWVAATVLLLAALGMLIWLFAPKSMPFALCSVGLIGLSIGAELDLLSFFCARLFGLRHYAAIYGGLAVFFYTGIAAGGVAYGIIHDALNNYHVAIGLSATLLVIAAALFISLGTAEIKATAPSAPNAVEGVDSEQLF
jgi:predicted MFS family arabinose efflux permease